MDHHLRKFGKFTVPDFIGERYYSNQARLVAVFCSMKINNKFHKKDDFKHNFESCYKLRVDD